MNVDFLFLLAQQQQAGGGNTWTMTAGAELPSFPGYSDQNADGVPGGGSISNQPVSGLTLVWQLSSAAGSRFALSFDGDHAAALNAMGFTEFVVNGVSRTVAGWAYEANEVPPITYAVLSGDLPVYANGTTYNCELR